MPENDVIIESLNTCNDLLRDNCNHCMFDYELGCQGKLINKAIETIQTQQARINQSEKDIAGMMRRIEALTDLLKEARNIIYPSCSVYGSKFLENVKKILGE